ncbi:MAG: outer membrane beta-barrel protein [Rhodopseudomonas sp.]|nr:outer membrane beta-barrel protein [Rhodopseudomonas sp.]
MKNAILALTLAATATSGAAMAADIARGPSPYYSAPAQGAYYNWGGAYAGVNVGYQWGSVSNTSTNPSGLEGGLTGGYNWQNGQFVYGVETDLQISGADDTFAPYKFSNPWFGTLRGRGGIAMNNVLFYGTVGLAYGGLKGENAGLSESKTEIGWTAGLGAEVGFTPNWSAKLEYLYADLSNRTYSVTGTENGLSSSFVRIGVNYHF